MKKFLIFIMLLAMTTPFIFAYDIENMAGEGNYMIDMKLHNFVQSMYTNTIATEICLPVHEKLKIYIDASFSDDSRMDIGSAYGYFNNSLKMFFGIPITDTVHFTVMLGGATAVSKWQYYDNTAWATNDFDATTLTGDGKLFFGLGLKLKSALFGSVIEDLYVRQNFTFHLNGNGNSGGTADTSPFAALVGPSVNGVGGDTFVSDLGDNGGLGWGVFNRALVGANYLSPGTTAYQNYQYWGMDYSGTIGTGILFDVGLPKLALAFELSYAINYISYTTTNEYTYVSDYWGRYDDNSENGQIQYSINNDGDYDWLNVYTTKPSMFGGDVGLKIALKINPNENVESETYIKPGFNGKSYSWEYFNSENGKSTYFSPEFYLKVGANWKYSFPKFVWIKLDCEWKLSISNSSGLVDDDTLDLIQAEGKQAITMFNQIDPGLTVGFNLNNWSIEAKWAPAIYLKGYYLTYDADGNEVNHYRSLYQSGSSSAGTQNNGRIAGSDSNILNLANWDIGVKVSFPPPAK